MTKRIILLAAMLAVVVSATAQSDTTSKKFRFDFHGFVNPHYYADSREVVGGREDMMLFYPKPIVNDANGNDLNDGWQANMMSITTRLGVHINGPDIARYNMYAYIEGDFTGSTNASNNDLRLRHAYFVLEDYDGSKGGTSLLIGQYWYPMVIPEIMPMTNPLNMGAPFHCYARYNQVRYDIDFPAGIHNVFTAAWQLDNTSQGLLNGVQTSSTQFARHTLVPELNYRFSMGEDNMLGAAFNWKTIQPIVPDPQDRRHTSFSWTLFGKMSFGMWKSSNYKPSFVLKAQALFNNSLYEGCSLGGYLMLADSTFEDWHFNTVWIDFERTKGNWRPGIFLGFAKNKDFGNTNYSYCFGRGHDIEYLWRVQPRITHKCDNGLSFTAEAEYTRAGYATPVGNLRLSLTMQYDF